MAFQSIWPVYSCEKYSVVDSQKQRDPYFQNTQWFSVFLTEWLHTVTLWKKNAHWHYTTAAPRLLWINGKRHSKRSRTRRLGQVVACEHAEAKFPELCNEDQGGTRVAAKINCKRHSERSRVLAGSCL